MVLGRHQEGHPPVALTVMRTRLEITSACAYACVCDERPLDYPFVTGSSGRELPALMATPAIAKGDVCVDHGDLHVLQQTRVPSTWHAHHARRVPKIATY